jgi:drug/metabolite transporter (DMT)-like permease
VSQTQATDETDNPSGRVLAGVLVAVASVSAAAIFIRLADAPALAVATWRNVFAVAILLPVVLVRREAMPRGRSLGLALLSGVALAFHFALWISSLDHTTVAASVVLVCTQPIFVTLFAWLLLKEKTSAGQMAGIGVAFVGTVLIAADDSVGQGALGGNLLALGGAVAVAVYVLIGRRVRSSGVALLPYATVVYATAGLVLLPTTLLLAHRDLPADHRAHALQLGASLREGVGAVGDDPPGARRVDAAGVDDPRGGPRRAHPPGGSHRPRWARSAASRGPPLARCGSPQLAAGRSSSATRSSSRVCSARWGARCSMRRATPGSAASVSLMQTRPSGVRAASLARWRVTCPK